MPSQSADPGRATRHLFEDATAGPGKTLLLLLAVLLPAIVAFTILCRQGISVPYQDDYAAILEFAVNYDQSPALKTKLLHIATDQVNEYKLSFEHFIAASDLELTHHVNFGLLTGLGNSFLLAIAYLLWRTYQQDGQDLDRRLLAFLPISLIFFSLTYWENLNWATTDLQNIPVVFFSLLAIYLLFPGRSFGPSRLQMLLSCLSAALAACSSANGFLLGPVGLLIFLPRRAYAKSLLWCAAFVPPFAAYLYHFSVPPHAVHWAVYLTRPLFFLAFLGCAIPFRWPAALLGIGVLAILGLAVRTRFDRTNPVAVYFALWIIATATLVAWVRGALGFGLTSRYSIYSILLLIFCYAFLQHSLSGRWSLRGRKRFYAASVVAAGMLCVLADINAYRYLSERRRMILTGIEMYRANPDANSPMIDPRILKAYPGEDLFEQRTLTGAIRKHLYTLPPRQEIR
jgi:hypothetical protein